MYLTTFEGESDIMTFLLWFMTVGLIFISVIIIIMLIIHIFLAIGLFKIAKRTPEESLAWLAWIPIANTFLIPRIVEQEAHENVKGKLTLIYGISIAGAVLLKGFIPFISLLPIAILMYAFFLFMRLFSPNAIVHTVLSIVTGFIWMAFVVFVFRNKPFIDYKEVEGN